MPGAERAVVPTTQSPQICPRDAAMLPRFPSGHICARQTGRVRFHTASEVQNTPWGEAGEVSVPAVSCPLYLVSKCVWLPGWGFLRTVSGSALGGGDGVGGWRV